MLRMLDRLVSSHPPNLIQNVVTVSNPVRLLDWPEKNVRVTNALAYICHSIADTWKKVFISLRAVIPPICCLWRPRLKQDYEEKKIFFLCQLFSLSRKSLFLALNSSSLKPNSQHFICRSVCPCKLFQNCTKYHSRILGTFMGYEENEILWLCPLGAVLPTLNFLHNLKMGLMS